MNDGNQNIDVFTNLEFSWEEENVSFLQWFKIIAFSFVIPMGIVILVNELAVLWKIIYWFQANIEFWTIRRYRAFSLIIVAIPFVYSIWLYYVTATKLLRLMHEQFFKKITVEIGKLFAKILMESASQQDLKLSIERVITYLNRQLSKLPGILEWVARKLFDKIPFIKMANWYNVNDIDGENQAKIAVDVANKLDDIIDTAIDDVTPWWIKFILPMNVIVLYFYWSL